MVLHPEVVEQPVRGHILRTVCHVLSLRGWNQRFVSAGERRPGTLRRFGDGVCDISDARYGVKTIGCWCMTETSHNL